MCNRYSEIRKKLKEKLQEKTSWGRNELLTAIDEVLLEAADDEIQAAEQKQPAWVNYTW